MITWIVISNSLDIDFIHGDIHGQLCKKCSITQELSAWFGLCCDYMLVSFTHILEGYFTGTGAIPSASGGLGLGALIFLWPPLGVSE